MTGFAVVTIDNRGSANRGMQFEAYVKVKYIKHVIRQLLALSHLSAPILKCICIQLIFFTVMRLCKFMFLYKAHHNYLSCYLFSLLHK